RLYEENLVNSGFSELYGPYDGLNRLTTFQRGTLDAEKDGISGTASRNQSWDLDQLGNWNSVTSDSVQENRTHNSQNQLTQVGTDALTFDANGNTLTDETGKQLVYDGWNRLVVVKDTGGSTLTGYSYDALNRRIAEAPAAGTATA